MIMLAIDACTFIIMSTVQSAMSKEFQLHKKNV